MLFCNLIFPINIEIMNKLDMYILSIPSTSQLKSSVRNLPPKHLNYLSAGERKLNIILARLRHRSSLKSNLFNIKIIDNRNCSCGAEVENAEHCPLYDVEAYLRIIILLSILLPTVVQL